MSIHLRAISSSMQNKMLNREDDRAFGWSKGLYYETGQSLITYQCAIWHQQLGVTGALWPSVFSSIGQTGWHLRCMKFSFWEGAGIIEINAFLFCVIWFFRYYFNNLGIFVSTTWKFFIQLLEFWELCDNYFKSLHAMPDLEALKAHYSLNFPTSSCKNLICLLLQYLNFTNKTLETIRS